MSDFVGIDIQGLEPLRAKLTDLIDDLIAFRVTTDVAVYLLNVMRQYAPYRHISRAEAYGQPFQSDRQRRWFFWAIAEGLIESPYQRTQTLAQGWKIIGTGTNLLLANEVEYAPFVQGDSAQQANMMTLEGWSPLNQVLEDRSDRIQEIVVGRIQRMLKR